MKTLDREIDALRLLAEYVIYRPEDGTFIWRTVPRHLFDTAKRCSAWNRMFAGKQAFNSLSATGYLRGAIKNRRVMAHRAVWYMETGEIPDIIDHINGVKTDNRFCNLRNTTKSLNGKNSVRHKNNKSGQMGVQLMGGKWVARINVDKQRIVIGRFDSFDAAVRARKDAEALHGYSYRHGADQ